MYKRILIPTDGSKLSEKAIKQGLTLAKKLQAKVVTVYVYSPYVIGLYGDVGPGYELVRRRVRELGMREGRKYLDRVEALAKASRVKIQRFAVENVSPWKGIVDVARKTRCDLILMGAHGRGAVSGLFLGSETNAVLAHSKVPVLVYR